MKTVYCLRIRESDEGDWSEPVFYRTRKERDEVARLNRCLGGIRCWLYEERKAADEVEELFDE
jgi:hypothetical protein